MIKNELSNSTYVIQVPNKERKSVCETDKGQIDHAGHFFHFRVETKYQKR
jgi:hypothetical protein